MGFVLVTNKITPGKKRRAINLTNHIFQTDTITFLYNCVNTQHSPHYFITNTLVVISLYVLTKQQVSLMLI